MRDRPYVPDQWGPLSHKQALGKGEQPSRPEAPSWTGYHARRLTAYVILQSYLDNNSRSFLPVRAMLSDNRVEIDLEQEKREEHREYGDAETVRDQIRAALLGDAQEIVVADAANFDAELEAGPSGEPEIVKGPDDQPLLGPDAKPLTRPLPGPTPEELEENAVFERAAEREDWMREWADLEQLFLQMVECENNAVGLGDGVYVLGWSEKKKRVRLDHYEPDGYFPVLTDGPSGDYPRRVHMAWQVLTEDDSGIVLAEGDTGHGTETTRQIRRITWDLGPISLDDEGGFVDDADFFCHRDPETRLLVEGAGGEDADTFVGRWYPWQLDDDGNPADGEEPSIETCYLTDALWQLTGLRAPSPDDFSNALVTIQRNEDGTMLDRLDLRIDFVPVIHVPNTPARRHHFGRSSLSRAVQLLDDLQTTDTDLQAAAGTTGSPPIWTSGPAPADSATGQVKTYGPGQWFDLGPEGAMHQLDTSKSLDALLKYLEALLDRLSVVVRLPAAVLGRVKPSEVPSGVALLLSFSPMSSMIGELRLTRAEKYPLLLKFVQRLAQVGSGGREGIGLPPGPTHAAWVAFGSFLPNDRTAVVEEVTKLLTAKAISRQTAVQLLIDAGFEIDDARDEIDRIAQEDFAGAVELLDATGNEEAVSDYLGVDVVRPAAPPARPPAPGAPTSNVSPNALPTPVGGPQNQPPAPGIQPAR